MTNREAYSSLSSLGSDNNEAYASEYKNTHVKKYDSELTSKS